MKNSGTDTPAMGWAGSSVTARFTGTSVAAKLVNGPWGASASYYAIIDGNDSNPPVIEVGDSIFYPLATDLRAGEHTVTLFRLSDAWSRSTTFEGFVLDENAELLELPPRPGRRIEFYGDSITSGSKMPGEALKTNHYKSFAAIAARKLGAEHVAISKGGLGLRDGNYAGGQTLIQLHSRLLPLEPKSRFDFETWKPQIVVVDILQNDSWLKRSSDEEYLAAYVELLEALRAARPEAHIIAALGPMNAVAPGSKWPGLVERAVAQVKAAKPGDKLHSFFFSYLGPGTSHPTAAQAENAADELVKFIESLGPEVWQS